MTRRGGGLDELRRAHRRGDGAQVVRSGHRRNRRENAGLFTCVLVRRLMMPRPMSAMRPMRHVLKQQRPRRGARDNHRSGGERVIGRKHIACRDQGAGGKRNNGQNRENACKHGSARRQARAIDHSVALAATAHVTGRTPH